MRSVRELEAAQALDGPAAKVGRAADAVATSGAGPALRGEWLGHALHPMLTDLALGCWSAASLLDLAAWRRGEVAARRLVGLGILFAAPTVASGLAEYATITDQRTRRVAAVHAIGNAVGTVLYVKSWRARHRGHHVRGVMLAALGGSLGIATGYLGGHLSFVLGVGAGERSGNERPIALPEHADGDESEPALPHDLA